MNNAFLATPAVFPITKPPFIVTFDVKVGFSKGALPVSRELTRELLSESAGESIHALPFQSNISSVVFPEIVISSSWSSLTPTSAPESVTNAVCVFMNCKTLDVTTLPLMATCSRLEAILLKRPPSPR